MRTFFTTVFAFLLSAFGGGLVAQQLAVSTGAQEEYIIVFALVAIVAMVATAMFWVAQLRGNPVAAVATLAKWLLVLFGLFLVALLAWSWSEASLQRDGSIIAGLVLPGIAVVLIQWWFVGWRVRRTPASFGRHAA